MIHFLKTKQNNNNNNTIYLINKSIDMQKDSKWTQLKPIEGSLRECNNNVFFVSLFIISISNVKNLHDQMSARDITNRIDTRFSLSCSFPHPSNDDMRELTSVFLISIISTNSTKKNDYLFISND